MSQQAGLFPLEFLIEETPKSLQAGSRARERWRGTVKEAVQGRIRDVVEWYFLDDRRLAVTIFYFAPGEMEGDIDNIVKPILDGMAGSAYLDDRLVERVLVQKFEPGVEWSFADVTGTLAEALDVAPPVVYVRIDDALGWRML